MSSMHAKGEQRDKHMQQEKVIKNEMLYFTIPFNFFGLVTVSLPFFSLVICFFSSILTKLDEVNETVCGANNFIPSISAITGTSPQRYLWRICIALQSAPRIAIGFMYYFHHMGLLHSGVLPRTRPYYTILVTVNLILYLFENATLVGVTYISNKDNYPIHEKIFIIFMFSVGLYMATSLIIESLSHQLLPMSHRERRSHRMKWIFFITMLGCTTTLCIYFYKHRFLCEDNAFSWFSASEYGIAVSNMGFHLTGVLDFKHSYISLHSPQIILCSKHDSSTHETHKLPLTANGKRVVASESSNGMRHRRRAVRDDQ